MSGEGSRLGVNIRVKGGGGVMVGVMVGVKVRGCSRGSWSGV